MKKWIVLIATIAITMTGCRSGSVQSDGVKFGTLNESPRSYNYVYGGTVQQEPILIRTQTANATMLDNDTKSWSYCKANFVPIPSNWSWVLISVYAYDANNVPDGNTGTIYVYGCERGGGARLIEYGNFTLGTTQMSHNPVTGQELNSGEVSQYYTWADTYTSLATDVWPDNQLAVSGAGGSDPNGNIMSIWIDRMPLYGIYTDVNNVTFGNAGADLTSVTTIMSGGT